MKSRNNRQKLRDRNKFLGLSEWLEPRIMLATYTVTSNGSEGPSTLAAAITLANGHPGSTIDFHLNQGSSDDRPYERASLRSLNR